MILSSLILLCSFAVLVWSADRFVFGAAALARNFGVPTLVVGLTIVAMGSSAPEMMTAAQAALIDKTDIAAGNAIGSNIANILLVLGFTALLRPLSVSSSLLRREIPLLALISLAAWYIIYDNYFSFLEGISLLIGFILFLFGLFITTKRQQKTEDPFVNEACDDVPTDIPNVKAGLWLLFGLILLPLSAKYLIASASDIAAFFGMSDLLIGLTIIAIGTSLPELAACVASVIKKEDDLALGNIIGSNIFNILAVLSIAGILNPSALDTQLANRDIYVMCAATLALILMSISLKSSRRINRFEGGILLSGFIGYMYFIV